MLISNIVLSFLQKNWKAVLLIVSLLILVLSIHTCNIKVQQLKDLKAAAHFKDSLSDSKLKYWKDQFGMEHAQVENIASEHVALIEGYDSIAKLLDVKPKEVQAVSKTSIKIQAEGQLRIDTVKVSASSSDTSFSLSSAYEFHWKDAYMQVNGTVGEAKDSVHVEGTDTLSRVDYWKRKWFLGAKHYYSDFTNTNPHIKIVGYKGLSVQQPEKRWNVSLSVSYGYPVNSIQLNKPVFFVGVSAGYSLFTFK